MMAEVNEGIEINDDVLTRESWGVGDSACIPPSEKDAVHLSDEAINTESNEGGGNAKKFTGRVATLLAWSVALLASAMLVSTAFTFFGAEKSRGGGESSLEVSSVNSAAVALADCLEEERVAEMAAAIQVAETEPEPTLKPTAYEPTSSPLDVFMQSNDNSLDGSTRRNLRISKSDIEGATVANMRRLQCEEILAESRSPTGEPTETILPTEIEQTKTPTYLPTTQPSKTPSEYRSESVIAYWTPDRIQEAEPRHYTLYDIDIPPAPLSFGNDTNAASFVDNDPWEFGGNVLQAAGRLVFRNGNSNYRCSATAVTDNGGVANRSIILTAAHCVYDETSKAFHTNFLFIPNQDDQGTDITDINCDNDPFGCWTPSFAVIDNEWSNKRWPGNIPSDYAFLVVNDVGSHKGPSTVNTALDKAVKALDVNFQPPVLGSLAYALGYPGDKDTAANPSDFRYCRRTLEERPDRGGYVLDGCGLQGGASGGPWIQNIDDEGEGEVIAVNSYGPGGIAALFMSYMGAPRLHSNSAECLYEKAKAVADDEAGIGIIVTYIDGDCAASTFVTSTGQSTSSPTDTPTAASTFVTSTGQPTSSPTDTPTETPNPQPTIAPIA